ncbi:hypothetical protein CYMTET_52383 [Cymbomonas tetramitiformis]|uniref:Uncharacterized protein n=1 Tax=Cymbomonas tetramitiformis TaxID=36881 RepID=A0AAE0ERE2_9CHLO|nr:hypothetical protein CYMTET_52383 [Cymbomonas tetramitiformis]
MISCLFDAKEFSAQVENAITVALLCPEHTAQGVYDTRLHGILQRPVAAMLAFFPQQQQEGGAVLGGA